MNQIIPTITVSNIQDYNKTLDDLSFAPRLHIDVMDGKFAKPQSINLVQAHWPDNKQIDIHMMVDNPMVHVETLVAQKPDLVVLHAESATFSDAFAELISFDIKVGIALLPETRPDDVPEIVEADHVLIFGGKLGSYGGQADLSQLKKVEQIRAMNKNCEIGWDGGANADSIPQIVTAGVSAINVGSAIQKANKQEAFTNLVDIVS